MKINPHIKLALMAFAGALLPTLLPLLYSLMAGEPIAGWRPTLARAVVGAISTAIPYVMTSPYNTKIAPNLVANTADMSSAASQPIQEVK